MSDGSWWRTYAFINDVATYGYLDSPERAYQGARAFGAFIGALSDLSGPPLNETIRSFHDTQARFAALDDALARDPLRRARDARAEIAYCMKNASLANALDQLKSAGIATECVTHNDTKINNVLFDDASGEGICVVDLDTVMPGLAPYDFGEIIRTATLPVAEDERDLSLVEVSLPMFQAVTRGFIDGSAKLLSRREIEYAVVAGRVMAFENGLRFLTDHLVGDTYFRIGRAAQNLDRARTQFAFERSLECHEERLRSVIAEVAGACTSLRS